MRRQSAKEENMEVGKNEVAAFGDVRHVESKWIKRIVVGISERVIRTGNAAIVISEAVRIKIR